MEILHKIPITLDERLAYEPELRIPASWEEFLEMLEECEYRIEYDEDEIISFMGYATENHEALIAELIRLIGNLLTGPSYRIYGSNLALHIPGFVRRYYNADLVVVQGPVEKIPLRGPMSAVGNPALLVEVLSPATRDFDMGHKLTHYQKIPCLQQILYIDSDFREVTSCRQSRHWLPEIFSGSDAFSVLDAGVLSLDDLYRKVELK